MFDILPTIEEIIAMLPAITPAIAGDILFWSEKWGNGCAATTLGLVNHFAYQIDSLGVDEWDDILRATVLDMIRVQQEQLKTAEAKMRRLQNPRQ